MVLPRGIKQLPSLKSLYSIPRTIFSETRRRSVPADIDCINAELGSLFMSKLGLSVVDVLLSETSSSFLTHPRRVGSLTISSKNQKAAGMEFAFILYDSPVSAWVDADDRVSNPEQVLRPISIPDPQRQSRPR